MSALALKLWVVTAILAITFAPAGAEHYSIQNPCPQSTTSTAWQDYVELTTSVMGGNYLILATAEVNESATANFAKAQMTIDGTAWGVYNVAPKNSTNYQTFITHKVANLAAGSHTVKVQYASSKAQSACTIRDARIVIVSLDSFGKDDDQDAQTSVTTTEKTVASLAYPATAGDHLIIATAEPKPSSTSASLYTRLKVDGAVQDEDLQESQNTGNYYTFGAMRRVNLAGGTRAITITAQAESGTMAIRRPRILVVPMSAFAANYYAESESESSTTNTAWQAKATLAFTPTVPTECLILTTSRIKENSESHAAMTRLVLDAAAQSDGLLVPKDVTDYATTGVAYMADLKEVPHTFTTEYCSSSASGTAFIKSSRILAICFESSTPQAANYYVKNGGNDNADGLTDATAWATLRKVNSRTFHPGDNINLKCGSTWNETLAPKGNGTSATPIRVMAYGTGATPKIAPQATNSSCVFINGYAGWEIHDLELCNARYGVNLRYVEDVNNDYMWLDNLYIHDMDATYNSNPYLYNHLSSAIVAQAYTASSSLPTYLNHLYVTDITIDNCWNGLWCGAPFETCNPSSGFSSSQQTYIANFAFENVMVTDAAQTGLNFVFMHDGTVTNCDVNNAGWGTYQYGTTGGLVCRAWRITFDGCDFYNISRGPQAYDGCGWDFEGHTAYITFKNSEIRNTDGCGIFVFDNGGTGANNSMWIENVRVTNFGLNPGNTSGGIFVGTTIAHSGTVKWCRFNRNIPTNPFLEGNYTQLTYDSCEFSDVVSTGMPTYATVWQTGYEPSKATDWNWGTFWCAPDGTMPQSLWVDLGATMAVTRIEQEFWVSGTWGFKFWGSTDGTSWSLITDASAGYAGKLFWHNGGGMYRWIMMEVTSGWGNWACSTEFSVYAY